MLRLMARRTNDVTYFTNDAAHELDGLRRGGPGWWLRGEGETRDPGHVAQVQLTKLVWGFPDVCMTINDHSVFRTFDAPLNGR